LSLSDQVTAKPLTETRILPVRFYRRAIRDNRTFPITSRVRKLFGRDPFLCQVAEHVTEVELVWPSSRLVGGKLFEKSQRLLERRLGFCFLPGLRKPFAVVHLPERQTAPIVRLIGRFLHQLCIVVD